MLKILDHLTVLLRTICLHLGRMFFKPPKGNSKRSKNLKKDLENVTELKAGLISGKTCNSCCHSVLSTESIKCSNCNTDYHITCLNRQIPAEVIPVLQENPFLFWSCFSCTKDYSKCTNIDSNLSNTTGTEVKETIQLQFGKMKSDLLIELARMTSSIEFSIIEKFSNTTIESPTYKP